MAEGRYLFLDAGALVAAGADDLAQLQLREGVLPALLQLQAEGVRPVFLEDGGFRNVQDFLARLFRSQGVSWIQESAPVSGVALARLAATYVGTGALDRRRSRCVGAGIACGQLAEALDVALVDPQRVSWPRLAREIVLTPRTGRSERRTRETNITVEVDLDGAGEVQVTTGIGYYDHLLEQVAKHGDFGLRLKAEGDLHVDEHHTVEDVALALGEAMRRALGDKRGIGRYGFTLPMDEAQARVAVDLSGRPYAVFRGDLRRDRVGELPTELIPHFFRSFADALGAAVHVEVDGENAHHMVEASFKGLGRALRPALRRGEGVDVPSTKGAL